MNKYNKSLDSILPTDQEKNRILNDILIKKSRNNKRLFYYPLFASLCVLLIILVSGNIDSNKNIKSVKINYNGTNYCEYGKYNSSIKNLKEVKGLIPGGTIYIVDNNKIVLYIDNVYKDYRKCRGE